jgi:hypothetical protein
MWNIENWRFLERETVTDLKGRRWTVALMDVLGQEGDPEMPSMWAELQYASGRYFTLVFSSSGTVQRERGYGSLDEATAAYERLLEAVVRGEIDPAQPVFRADLED